MRVAILKPIIFSSSTFECPELNISIPNIFDDIISTDKYTSHVITTKNTKNVIYLSNHIIGPREFVFNRIVLYIDNIFNKYAIHIENTLNIQIILYVFHDQYQLNHVI